MPSFGRQAAAGDTSADVVHSFRVNAVLPDGAVEAREQTLAYQSKGQCAVEVARREALMETVDADRRRCNAVSYCLSDSGPGVMLLRAVQSGQLLVLHGCPGCRVEFQYCGDSDEAVGALVQRSEPLLRCPRCAPPP